MTDPMTDPIRIVCDHGPPSEPGWYAYAIQDTGTVRFVEVDREYDGSLMAVTAAGYTRLSKFVDCLWSRRIEIEVAK